MRTHTTPVLFLVNIIFWGMILSGCWPQAEPDPVRVRMLYSIGGKGDNGWNDTSYSALYNARQSGGTVFIEAQPLDLEDAATHFFQWLADPADNFRELIVANSGKYTPLVEQGECNFGQRKIVLFEGQVTGCEAVQTVSYHSYSTAFIAGATAARASQTGHVAVIAESASDEAKALATGFCDGAKYVATAETEPKTTQCFTHFIPTKLTGVPDTPVHQSWAHNYEVIKWSQFFYEHKNVDIVFGATERDNSAIFDVAEAKSGRYAIGLDSDQSIMAPSVVIGSVVRRTDLTLRRIITDYEMAVFARGSSVVGYKCHSKEPQECTTAANCSAHQGCDNGICTNELDYVASTVPENLGSDLSDTAMNAIKKRNQDDENAALAASAEFYGSGATQCD